jgi:DNA mismatch endonuclease, patch repair protein
MDHLTKEKRSWNMSRIRSKDTSPEKIVRSLLHSMGYRFRLHGKVNKKLYKKGVLPGKPDIVLSRYKTVIFVHGCFWHRHENCKKASTPKTRTEWWQNKFDRNVSNDKKHQQELKSLGWNVIVIWECEVEKIKQKTKGCRRETKHVNLKERLRRELSPYTYELSEENLLMIAAEEKKEYE